MLFVNLVDEPSTIDRTILITVHQTLPSTSVTCPVSVNINLINDNTPVLDLNGPDVINTNWTTVLVYTFPELSHVAIASDSVTFTDGDQGSMIQQFTITLVKAGVTGDQLVLSPNINCINPSNADHCYIRLDDYSYFPLYIVIL